MSITTLIEKTKADLRDKKRWRAYKARTRALPPAYGSAIAALERYLLHYGAIAKGDVLVAMLEDLADLFEQAASDGTPIRGIVGDDPVEFAEDFLRNYAKGQWIDKERVRLTEAIERAAGTQGAGTEGAGNEGAGPTAEDA